MHLHRLYRLRCAVAAAVLACSAARLYSVPATLTFESKDYLCVGFSGSVVLAQLVLTNNYSISSPTDPNYLSARPPLRVGRRSQLLEFPRYPNYSLRGTNGHWACLELPAALADGHSYTVRVQHVADATLNLACRRDDAATRNGNIKVNQVGYLPDAATKFGYLGGYLGSLGALPLAFATTAFVCRASDGVAVFAAPVTLRADQNKVYTNPTYLEREITGESVYQFDFSGLTNAGRYHVRVPGLGISAPFAIAPDLHWRVFTNVALAVYLQRCGIAVSNPFSPVFHHGVCHTQAMELTTSSNVDGFITAGTGLGQFLHDLRGGYHDAGDYDRRVYHLAVARQMLDLYAMLSNKLTDAQWHIPEAGNRIPDVLDEVAWGLRIWFMLQDPLDGGVRGGTERLAEGGMDEPVDDPDLDYYVFGKYMVNNSGVVHASAWFAAAAAQLARSILPFDAATAQQALDAARRAYAYALAHGVAGADKADAAAELFCTTGESAYHQDFLATGVRESFSYATCSVPGMDAAAQSACRTFWTTRASDAVTFTTVNNSYRCARNPYTPIRFGGGTGGHVRAFDLCKGYALSGGNGAYLAALQHDANFVLGCNPLGRSWITGVGAVTPEMFLHRQLVIDGRTNIPPGYHIYGPFAKSSNGDYYGSHYETFWTNLFPATLTYPRMRAYVASEWMAGMNEFTITETLSPSFCTFAFAHLAPLPAPAAPPDTLPPGILILTPAPGSDVPTGVTTVSVRVADAGAVAGVYFDGAGMSGTTWYARAVTIADGSNLLAVIARDASGNSATAQWHVMGVPEPPVWLALPALLGLRRRRRSSSDLSAGRCGEGGSRNRAALDFHPRLCYNDTTLYHTFFSDPLDSRFQNTRFIRS